MAQGDAVSALSYDGEAHHDTFSFASVESSQLPLRRSVTQKAGWGDYHEVELTQMQGFRRLSLPGRRERRLASLVVRPRLRIFWYLLLIVFFFLRHAYGRCVLRISMLRTLLLRTLFLRHASSPRGTAMDRPKNPRGKHIIAMCSPRVETLPLNLTSFSIWESVPR